MIPRSKCTQRGTICAQCKHAKSPWYLASNWAECALDGRRRPAYLPNGCDRKVPIQIQVEEKEK